MRPICTLLATIFCGLAFADEQWLSTGKDEAFPGNRFFVGVGVSEKSQTAARENAIVEIQKQISVSINATTSDDQLSVMKGKKEKYSSRTESSTKLTVAGDVQGIEIVKTAFSKKAWYALAVLDKSKFASACRFKIAELQKQLAALAQQADEDIEAQRISVALGKLASANALFGELSQERTILSAAAQLSDREAQSITQVDILTLYEKCVSSLVLNKSDGDGQTFSIGRGSQNPFTLTVFTGDVPAPGIPVSLTDQNNTEVAAGLTDDSGVVRLFPDGMANLSPGKHAYTASIALAVSGTYKKMLDAQSQSFACTAVSNPCFAKIDVSVDKNIQSGKNEIVKAVTAVLSRYDIKADPGAASALSVKVTADSTGAGAAGNRTSKTVTTGVRLDMALQDEDGRSVVMVTLAGTGSGPTLVKAAQCGINEIKIDRNFDQIFDYLSRDKQEAGKPKLNIAVSGFKVKDEEACSGCNNLAANLTTMVTTQLVKMERVTVVEREFLDKIVAERNLAASGLEDQSADEETGGGDDGEQAALKNARLAGADLLFLGTITGVDGKIEIDARVVNVKDGTARCSMTHSALSANEARAIADDLVKQIRGKCLR